MRVGWLCLGFAAALPWAAAQQKQPDLVGTLSFNVGSRSGRVESLMVTIGDGGTGKYKAVLVGDPSLPTHAIYRPRDLSPFAGNNLLPVVAFGNGGCRNGSGEFRNFLSDIASHGYLVVAIGPAGDAVVGGSEGRVGMTQASQLLDGVDWAAKQNSTEGSEYFRKIDTSEYGHQWDWSLPGIGTLEGTLGLLAGLCSAEGGSIVQVKDAAGHKLFADNGSWNLQRDTWPEGARPVPLFEPGLSKPKLVAITKPVALEFTLRPSLKHLPGLPPEPAMFSLIRGGNLSISVEDAMTSMQIDIDPADNSVRVAPVEGTGSAIIRFSQRLASGREALTHAVRLNGLQADKPVRAMPSQDRMAVQLSADNYPVVADVEVTHTDRYGKSRTLEVDGITVPALTNASLRVDKLADLGRPNATPLVLELKPKGVPHGPAGHQS